MRTTIISYYYRHYCINTESIIISQLLGFIDVNSKKKKKENGKAEM